MAVKRFSDGSSIKNSYKMSRGATSAAKPEAPTIGTATKTGSSTATVAYTAATLGAAGSTFTATSIPDSITGTGASPITVSGLTGSTNYTFTVKASNANGDSPASSASNQITTDAAPFNVDYLVVAGGGGGGNQWEQGGGGGAGGMRCTVDGTGGSGSVESALSLALNTNYTITVGSGGAINTQGSNSVFSTITSTGGGYGAPDRTTAAGSGGSGGGSGDVNATSPAGAASPANQGYAGGNGAGINNPNSWTDSGSGGGAGGTPTGNNNGTGRATSISGSSVTYSVGAKQQDGTGAANTGNGGGVNNGATNGNAFSPVDTGAGFAGGSGVVILKYPDTKTISFGAGVTGTESSASGGYKRATITAATAGNVSWS